MNNYASVVQSAAERLLEDERLRSSLSDGEANLLINWAIGWLEKRVSSAPDADSARQIVQTEMARLRPTLAKINDLLAGDQTPSLPNAVKALGLPASNAKTIGLPDRKTLVQVLISGLAKEWNKS